MQRFRPARVLLVEDNLDDIEITRRAFRRVGRINDLFVVRDGEEATNLLFRAGLETSMARPELVLLDINLPKVNGFEVLRQIRACEEFSTMPVVMLTASENEVDVEKSYRLGANSYIQKPVAFGQFLEVLELLSRYWFELVTLPASGRRRRHTHGA